MTYKILHYINQFFAGIGGEERADYEPEVRKGAVGPGTQIQKLLGDKAEVVATFVCGDNYFATNTEGVLAKFDEVLKEYQPDLIIAGPSFYAGRYGFACGHIANEAKKVLGIPGIAGMNVESPAVEMFHKDMYIIKTGDSARAIKPALDDIVKLAKKFIDKEEINSAAENNYFPRGVRANYFEEKCGGERAVEMLLKKMSGEEFVSEYLQDIPEKVPFAPAVKDLSKATIALLNTGGIVPIGNPDRIEGSSATKYGFYSIEGMEKLTPDKMFSVHGGFDTSFANADPNRIMPVDIMRDLVKEGKIGALHEFIYTTVGTGASLINAEGFGRAIAAQLCEAGVDAAIMVST